MEIQNTPLLNESDERMKPFAFNGSWLYWQPAVEHRLNAAWINRVSPRSTVEWYDFNEAIGLENNGYLPNGDPAEYNEKTGSNGIALLNYSYSIDAFSLEFHEWYLDRIMNTVWLQAVFEKNNWFGGLQYLYQWPLEQQRDLPEPDRYVQPGENGQVISVNAGMSDRGYAVSLSFSHAFDSGRFLFPRELGRDRVFTSVPRSRLEGFGDVDVLTLRGDIYPGRVRNLNLGLDFTRVFGAEADNFVFNKYGKDEYYQVNSRLHYDFQGFLKNLELDLLYVYKWNVNEVSPDVIFNRSNFHQVNLVTNFNF
ncbi:hypothetical protein [Robertkochia aurantiaca]|uniref:hypothetical protein n=1 Tax=Robertkochia aurantiaca TaxID=2873700 RepID=UPI001CCB8EB3|nr:hypothetical protein [Robertkochia sp. 3YJGBD-33]